MAKIAMTQRQEAQTFAFSKETLKKAADIIAKYPEGRQQSAVMPLLDIAQRQNGGYLNVPAMDAVAELLGMPYIRVYEVATFYTMYNHAPKGKHHVQVCTNLPCWLRGSDDVLGACKKHLGIEAGEVTSDGQISLSEAECLGACVNAPMIQIDHFEAKDAEYIRYYEDLDADSTVKLLKALQAGDMPAAGPQNSRHSSEPEGGATTLTDVSAAKKG